MYVKFKLEPVVIDAEVKSTVFGIHTGVGFVTNTVGEAFTTKFAVMLHPLELVYVIIVVPGEIPVTKPVLEMVAIPKFDDCQGVVAGFAEPDNVVVVPLQTDKFPIIVGKLFTVTVTVLEYTIGHPEF